MQNNSLASNVCNVPCVKYGKFSKVYSLNSLHTYIYIYIYRMYIGPIYMTYIYTCLFHTFPHD